MADNFERILDERIDRINRGDSLADCLSAYPAYAARLKPLLQSMYGVQEAYAFTPSAEAKRTARQRLHAAMEKQRQETPFATFLRLVSRPLVWAPVALLVLVIVSIYGIRPAISPPAIVSPTISSPTPNPPVLVSNPNGNFAFLISDEVNDIGDFENLYVTVSSIGLQSVSNTEAWTEFTPEVKTVDLTQLQGAQAQEIWRGDVPAGQYSQLFINASEVKGKLKATGQMIELKLPSSKLHMSKPFEVTADTVTSFNFDVTVVATGNNGKYLLKPQADASGAQQKPKTLEQTPNGGKGKDKK